MFAAKNFATRYLLKAGAVAMLGCLTLGLAGTFVPSAQAATIDTFDFTQTGWANVGGIVSVNGSDTYVVGSPDPGGMLTGSFTGTAEPDGYIELNDLTAFSATYTDDADPTGMAVPSLNSNDLTLFSFNTAGGNSSLDFADNGGVTIRPAACTGAAASLDVDCTDLVALNPAGTNGVFFLRPQGLRVAFLFTASLPSVSLAGSVTTPPPTAAPEPSSFLLTGISLLGLALVMRRRPARTSVFEAAVCPRVSELGLNWAGKPLNYKKARK
ncbi:MAG: PEP-CTERM sorting domain-containing protein [Terriglobia bacterium]